MSITLVASRQELLARLISSCQTAKKREGPSPSLWVFSLLGKRLLEPLGWDGGFLACSPCLSTQAVAWTKAACVDTTVAKQCLGREALSLWAPLRATERRLCPQGGPGRGCEKTVLPRV